MWGFLLLVMCAGQLCDIEINEGLCLYEGGTVLMPLNVPEGLMGHWTFDDVLGVDYSGNKNHAIRTVGAGTAFGGRGASAIIEGEEFIEIPHSETISKKIFSITFWMYLSNRNAGVLEETWCPLLQKGVDSSEYERAPGVFIDLKTRALRVYVSTGNAEFPEGEYVESYARMQFERWNSMGIVRSQSTIYLYVNGIFDNKTSTTDWTAINESPLLIGNTRDNCEVTWLVDELRFYDYELPKKEIEALAMGTLGQIEPRFIKLGCVDCSLLDAADICEEGYHLCTALELHSGGYAVAKANGWTELNSRVWAHSALEFELDEDNLGLGVCCKDLGN